ncbi:MAG: TIGR02147 family protein [Bdellovibrionota bacterium]
MTFPSIIDYDDPIAYLSDLVQFNREQVGLSFRALSKAAGFKSPNYIQRILRKEKKLSISTAEKLGRALGLSADENKYLVLLTKTFETYEEKGLIEKEELIQLKRRLNDKLIKTESIYSSWLHGIVWELGAQEGFVPNAAYVQSKLRVPASIQKIDESIEFLFKQGFLVQTSEDKVEQRPIRFLPYNDKKRIMEIQENHRTFLEMARHRVADDLKDRAFQGLTIGIPSDKMKEIKGRLKDFIQLLNIEYSDLPKSSEIIRVQLCAYKLTK